MNAEWQLLRKTKDFLFVNENQDQQIASFAKEDCHLVLSPDKKDIKLNVLWFRWRRGLIHRTSLFIILVGVSYQKLSVED